jgi:hypothetical protein
MGTPRLCVQHWSLGTGVNRVRARRYAHARARELGASAMHVWLAAAGWRCLARSRCVREDDKREKTQERRRACMAWHRIASHR